MRHKSVIKYNRATIKLIILALLSPFILLIILLIALIVLFLLFKIFYLVFPQGHAVAENPSRIGYSIDVDLPNYHVIDDCNNLDRGASCWDYFTYEIKFDDREDVADLDQELLKKVATDKRWTQAHDTIKFEDQENPIFGNEMYILFIHVLNSDKAKVDYMLTESFL